MRAPSVYVDARLCSSDVENCMLRSANSLYNISYAPKPLEYPLAAAHPMIVFNPWLTEDLSLAHGTFIDNDDI